MKAENEASETTAKPKKRSADSMELVEYSPDELQTVDKELLNAEITQLEGAPGISVTRDGALTMQRTLAKLDQISRFLQSIGAEKPSSWIVQRIWRLSRTPAIPPRSGMMTCGKSGSTSSWLASRQSAQS